MKKIMLFLIGLLFIITLTGCFVHNETVVFVGVVFYDSEGNEIQGEYKDYFSRRFDNPSLKLSSNQVVPINSAAPFVEFYCTEVEEGSTIKVVMKFNVKRGEVKSLTLKRQNDQSNKDSHMDKIEIIDSYTYVTYIVENITSENNIFEVFSWNDGTKSYRFEERGGNEYIRGFYFILANNTDDL